MLPDNSSARMQMHTRTASVLMHTGMCVRVLLVTGLRVCVCVLSCVMFQRQNTNVFLYFNKAL
jgi:hypothetical protein